MQHVSDTTTRTNDILTPDNLKAQSDNLKALMESNTPAAAKKLEIKVNINKLLKPTEGPYCLSTFCCCCNFPIAVSMCLRVCVSLCLCQVGCQ